MHDGRWYSISQILNAEVKHTGNRNSFEAQAVRSPIVFYIVMIDVAKSAVFSGTFP